MPWRVSVPKSDLRRVNRFPKRDRERIWKALREEMPANPLTGDIETLGHHAYRRRLGNYRIVFELIPELHLCRVRALVRRTTTTYRKR